MTPTKVQPPHAPVAPTVTFAFEGLMFFHTSPGGNEHLTIVDAPPHIPQFEIWGASPTTGNMAVIDHLILLANDRIAFTVAPGPVTRTALYNAHVPVLQNYVSPGGTIDPNVISKAPKAGALAYVPLVPGELTTWKTFTDHVLLKTTAGGADTRCFARFVAITMTVTRAGQPPLSFTINPDEVLLFSNIAHGVHLSPAGPTATHFQKYGNLLAAGGTMKAATILTGPPPCDVNDGVGLLRRDIEEILTAVPVRAPNGDCGPTGP
jgi:hypothetical protein